MLNTTTFHLSKKSTLPFSAAIEKVTEELRKEGFGIITYIDMKETFKKKINQDFRNYVILGACNPRYAYEALMAEDKVGVFLPCNVVVQQHNDREVEVSIVNPEELMHSIDDLSLRTLAIEIKQAMESVLDRM
jgi:uncharacterized protein (DUF302 family)